MTKILIGLIGAFVLLGFIYRELRLIKKLKRRGDYVSGTCPYCRSRNVTTSIPTTRMPDKFEECYCGNCRKSFWATFVVSKWYETPF